MVSMETIFTLNQLAYVCKNKVGEGKQSSLTSKIVSGDLQLRGISNGDLKIHLYSLLQISIYLYLCCNLSSLGLVGHFLVKIQLNFFRCAASSCRGAQLGCLSKIGDSLKFSTISAAKFRNLLFSPPKGGEFERL